MASFEGDAGPVLGIDLGTTFSCVAVYDDAEKKVKVLGLLEKVVLERLHYYNYLELLKNLPQVLFLYRAEM